MSYRYQRDSYKLPQAQLKHVNLKLSLFPDKVDGEETLFFKALENFEVLALDSRDVVIKRVEFGKSGEVLSSVVDNTCSKLMVVFPRQIEAGEEFSLFIKATGKITANILEGIYQDSTPEGAPQQLISQCQQWGFQRIMPIVDDCTAKCTWRTTLEADSRYTHIITNGDVDRTTNPNGVPVPIEGAPERSTITYVNPIPMPPYLFVVAAGTWDALVDDVVTPSGRKVRLEYLVPPGTREGARIPMSILKDSVLWQAKYVGYEYLRECYRTICMEKSNFGGMENVGNTTIITEAALLDKWTTDRRLSYAFGVIVHEYEHNHCGSDVTMQTPFDMWLNEAFTVTVEQAYMAEKFGADFARLDAIDGLRDPLRGPIVAEDGRSCSPIVRDGFDNPDDVVDGVTYDKAPEVLGMLKTLMGDSAYNSATEWYFKQYYGSNANTEQFLAAFQKFSQRDLTPFFKQWLFTIGYPKITATWRYNSQENTLSITLSQIRNAPETDPFIVPLKVRALSETGDIIPYSEKLLVLDCAEKEFIIPHVDKAPAFMDFNSGLPFYGTLTDSSATPQQLRLAVSTSPFMVGRVEAMRAILDTELKAIIDGDRDAPSHEFMALFAEVLTDSCIEPGIKARLLTVDSVMLDRDYSPRAQERAAAAKAVRRAVAEYVGEERLLDAFESARAMVRKLYAQAGGCEMLSPNQITLAIATRALVRAITRLMPFVKSSAVETALKELFDGAECVSEMVDAALALLEANATCKHKVLEQMFEQCRDHVGAYGAYLAVIASCPSEEVFQMVKEAESDGVFRPEHPAHSRSLYGALVRNDDVIWSDRGITWLEEKILAMASVNENVAILLLGALQDREHFPQELRNRVQPMIDRLRLAIPKIAPEAYALIARLA